jgi:hypothetical protein
MKRIFVLSAAMCLLLAVSGVYAQKPASFAGHWELDTAKSKLDERMRVESMTLDVAQTDKDIKVETKTKRAPRPDAAPGGGMGRGFGGGGGDTSMTYSLEGKETTAQQEGPNGPIPIKLTGKLDAGKLNLTSTRTFNGPNGEISIGTKEMWSLSPDGTTLTISRETSSPRGTSTSELVFIKK